MTMQEFIEQDRMSPTERFFWTLTRRKSVRDCADRRGELERCLGTFELVALGIGSTLNHQIYVQPGKIAAKQAGPALVLSFFLASIARTSSVLCYTEFTTRMPKCGSAFDYTYIMLGEFAAFIVGWTLLITHSIASASLANTISSSLRNNNETIFHQLPMINITKYVPLKDWTGDEILIDPTAFVTIMLVTGLLLLGIKATSKFQVVLTTINLGLMCFILICGLFNIDFHNWNLSETEITANAGVGGFIPFGMRGVFVGATTFYFTFTGLDRMSAIAEEVKSAETALAGGIFWTSGIVFTCYTLMVVVQTLIWPYYDQDMEKPLVHIFEKLDHKFAKWAVEIGWILNLSTNLTGALLPLPRIMYAMARDGLISSALATLTVTSKVPIASTILGGTVVALLASKFDLNQLVNMLVLGTLAVYSLVAVSILLLRYEHREPTIEGSPEPRRNSATGLRRTLVSIFVEGFCEADANQNRRPDQQTTIISRLLIVSILIAICLLDWALYKLGPQLYLYEPMAVNLCFALLAITFFMAFLLSRLPSIELNRNSYEVPMVPWLPLLSIAANVYLIMLVPADTWAQFMGLLAIGICVYYKYGHRHSNVYKQQTQGQPFQWTAPLTGSIKHSISC